MIDAPPDLIREVLDGKRPWHIQHGHNLDPLCGLSLLPDLSVDHCIFDPPFSRKVHRGARTNKLLTDGAHKIGFDPLYTFTRNRIATQLARITRRWIGIFCDFEEGVPLWKQALEDVGMEYIRTGIWIRENTMPQKTGDRPAQGAEAIVIAHRPGKKKWNGGGRPAVYSFPIVRAEARHETQKPLDLMKAILRDYTNRGDLIVDPFAGWGTTGAAAIELGRRCLMWERRKRDVIHAVRRLRGTMNQLEIEDAVPDFTSEPPRQNVKQFRFALDEPQQDSTPPDETMGHRVSSATSPAPGSETGAGPRADVQEP